MAGGEYAHRSWFIRSRYRIGRGAGYWRDYLKLSANVIFRASGWKKSPDGKLSGTPANGCGMFVLRLFATLAASSKLMYGDIMARQVRLFGKE